MRSAEMVLLGTDVPRHALFTVSMTAQTLAVVPSWQINTSADVRVARLVEIAFVDVGARVVITVAGESRSAAACVAADGVDALHVQSGASVKSSAVETLVPVDARA